MEQSNRRVLRGGAWFRLRELSRCAYRNWLLPDYQLLGLGFRVIKRKSNETK